MAVIRLLTSNATHALLLELADAFERESGLEVSLQVESAVVMLARIKEGESADVAVLNAPHLDELVELGLIDARSRRVFARSRIGVAVRAGEPHPDISTLDALKRSLSEARAVAHTVQGASGSYVPTLLARLGIADRTKTVTRPGGLIGKVVAAGEADLAVQQISELLAVPGIEVVGPLPEAVQKTLESAAGIFSASRQRAAAEALLRFFASPANARTFEARGLEAA